MKTTKKLLAIFLSVLMLLSSVAVVSFADNDFVTTEKYFDFCSFGYNTEGVKSITDVRIEPSEIFEGRIDVYFTVTLNEGYCNPSFYFKVDAPIDPVIRQDGYVYECVYAIPSNEKYAEIRAVSWEQENFDIHLINSRFDEASDSYHVFWDRMPYGSTPEYTEPETYRTEDGGIYEFIGWDIAVDGEFDGKVDAKKIENVKSDIYADAVFVNVHDHNSNPGDEYSCWELAGIVKATCTEDGAYKYICGRCHEGVTKEVKIPSRGGHTMSPWIDVIPATCTESGTKVSKCINIIETDLYKACDHTEVGEIAPLGHDFGEWVTVLEPTCSEKGKAERVCKNDASHKEYKDLEATGKHVDGDGDRQCDHCGKEFGHCSGCICHKGNVLSYVMRYLCTFLSRMFHTELKCCECMEWYKDEISSIS